MNTKGQHKKVLEVIEMLYILILVSVTRVKSHRTVLFSLVNFPVIIFKVKINIKFLWPGDMKYEDITASRINLK